MKLSESIFPALRYVSSSTVSSPRPNFARSHAFASASSASPWSFDVDAFGSCRSMNLRMEKASVGLPSASLEAVHHAPRVLLPIV